MRFHCIYLEQFCLVFIRITCSIWYFIQFVCIAIFMSLHGPAGACIPVASPIHVPPIQRVLKHCGGYIHNIIYIYIHPPRTPQLAGFARQMGMSKPASWGCKNRLQSNNPA